MANVIFPKSIANTIYATKNEPSEFFFEMPADTGPQCLCNFTIRPTWLTKEINDYIGIGPFLKKMEREATLALYSYMPACNLIKKIKGKMERLFSLVKSTKGDLELAQAQLMKGIVAEYQHHALIKLSHPVYQARDYLEENYPSPELDNETLINEFNMIEKTLIRSFKREFETTPYLYLTSVRMQHAYRMLMIDKNPLNEVYIAVGYADLHSFSTQFKKTFDFPPSDPH